MARAAFIWAALIGAALIMSRRKISGDVTDALNNANVRAFLALLRRYESAGKYDVVYAGGTFSDFSAHPKIRVPFFNPRTGKNDYSTAAGAYQITYPTWLTIQAVAFLPDFSPSSQDAAAVWLLKIRGALGYIVDGDIDNALRVASRTWASLPYTESGQAHINAPTALAFYKQQGGYIA